MTCKNVEKGRVKMDVKKDGKKLKIGYIRVSSDQQVVDRQRLNIKRACPECIIIEEHYTGTTMDRPNWNKLMIAAEKGKISDIYFDEPSRMGRTASDCFITYKHLFLDLKINLHFIKGSHIDTDVYNESLQSSMDKINVDSNDAAADKMINSIFEAIREYMLALVEEQIYLVFKEAENEAKRLGERTRSGIAAAKKRGVRFVTNQGYHFKNKEEWRCRLLVIKYHKDFGGIFDTPKVSAIIKHGDKYTLKILETIKVEQGLLRASKAKHANCEPYNYEIIGAEYFKEKENELWTERFGHSMKEIQLLPTPAQK